MSSINTSARSRLTLFFIITICMCWSSEGKATELPNAHGYIITREGKTIHFTRLEDKNRMFSFRYGPEEKNSQIPFASISSISFGEKSKTAQISLKDGRTIDAKTIKDSASYAYWEPDGHNFNFLYFDDVARKEELRYKEYYEISKIVLNENVGRFRRCPHCKGLWPDSYLFCPHDGSKTVWGETSGMLTISPSQSLIDREQRNASALDAVLNASLAKSGVDPESEEARQAKEFGKLWMNPFADPDDIQKKLDEIGERFKEKSPAK